MAYLGVLEIKPMFLHNLFFYLLGLFPMLVLLEMIFESTCRP
jgi:hypothetical protein